MGLVMSDGRTEPKLKREVQESPAHLALKCTLVSIHSLFSVHIGKRWSSHSSQVPVSSFLKWSSGTEANIMGSEVRRVSLNPNSANYWLMTLGKPLNLSDISVFSLIITFTLQGY